VAAQLLELGGRFPAAGVASFAAALEKDDANTKRIAECLNASLPNAYAVLQNASRDEMDAAATILQNAPWVWTGAGFAASADVAAFASASVSFEPYLFLVPKELSDENARPLLEAFGVRDRFRAVDFARAASRLAADAAGEPIGERRVALAAALADAAADALAEYENFPFENSAERSSERSGETSTSTSRRDFETRSKEKEKENAFVASGSFMLPDASGVMAPARELTRNDAEWLLGERKGDEDEDGAGDGAAVAEESALRFAHERVSASSAAALGARSLRELYAVDQASTDRLPCPSASVVRAFLEASAPFPDGDSKARVSVSSDEDAQRMTHFAIAAAATDILGIAEAAGAAVATVTLDVRSYATRSLLQPQLAGYQGPAIVFTLRSAVKTSSFKTRDEAKGPVPFAALDPNELAALFASAPPTKLRRGFLRAGEGLASCARLGDVVLALGGGRLCVFDPANVALSGDDPNAVSNEATIRETTNASDGDTNRLTSGSAKSFVTKDGALARRFADQFAPFVAAGWSPDGAADDDATYVRVPLRTATQASRRTALAPFGVHLAAARDALAAFAARAHAVLLFSSSVDEIVVGVASEARTETGTETETKTEEKQTNGSVDVLVDARVTRRADARVSSDAKPVPARVTPRTVEEDAEWRRSSLSVFFGGGANATRCSHVVTIEETSSRVSRESVFSEKASATNVDEWIVGAAIGVGKARELALDRTKSKFLHGGTLLPVARVASHVRRDGNAVDPARAPPAPAAASLAAVAARAVADGRVAIPFLSAPRPGSGLFALGAPVPPKPDALGVDAGDPVASALRRAPGVIDAHFATKRGASSARFVEFVDPSVFLSSETDDSTERSEADVARREWNRALCACVVAANVEVAAHARRISVPEPLPAATFYGLWPRSASLGVPPPPALDADGERLRVVEEASSATIASADSRFAGGHPASALYVRPLYKALAEHVPGLFRSLGTGAPTKPADGYFLPAGFAEGTGFNATTEPSNSAGARSAARPLAAKFIAKHFPVIDAPAEIRPELAAAGAGGAAKELTAAALRSLLRAKPPAPSEPTRVHVELLECATSDVIVAEDAQTRGAPKERATREERRRRLRRRRTA
jgi:sacsin